eukprot:GHRQ01000956.1.p1 GENE.GHRQ01000956.1~~GHRQ01000956.1.p1  ORF type:complete len:276 (+),score=85.02 GHRQ01000956.1:225-1052(+)
MMLHAAKLSSVHAAGAAALLAQLKIRAVAFSTQHEEQVRAPATSGGGQREKNYPGSAPVLGNTGGSSEPSGAHYDAGRSSQTIATVPADDEIKALVHRVFEAYECRSIERQREIIAELYDEGAVYENNVTLLQGRDALLRRFGLLPMTTSKVKIEYEAPMVLGATTTGPEALDNLADKGDMQVEVNNTQAYSFDRGHSMWRYILLPQGDLQLPVLTRLTLSRDGSKVLYHRDIWTHSNEWWRPMQRCWGALEKAAASSAAGSAAGGGKHGAVPAS